MFLCMQEQLNNDHSNVLRFVVGFCLITNEFDDNVSQIVHFVLVWVAQVDRLRIVVIH